MALYMSFFALLVSQKNKIMALGQRRTGKSDVNLSTCGEAAFSEVCSVRRMGRAVLFTLSLIQGASSIAERPYTALRPVCTGNVGPLQCLVSASAITQSLQALNATAFSMLEKWERCVSEVAAQSLWLHCNYGIRGRLGELGRGCQISEEHGPRGWVVTVWQCFLFLWSWLGRCVYTRIYIY